MAGAGWTAGTATGALGEASSTDGSASTNMGGARGPSISINDQGAYTIAFAHPAWTFGGNIGVAPTNVTNTTGADALGLYHDLPFAFTDTSAKTAVIRAYNAWPVVRFTLNYLAAANNSARFPALTTVPKLDYHLTYSDVEFAPFSSATSPATAPGCFSILRRTPSSSQRRTTS